MTATRRRVLQGGATEALPLGNGRLGAMVFGGVADERIQINEATFWGGGPHDYDNPEAFSHLAELRRLIFAGQVQDAEKLTARMMGSPSLLMPFQPFCRRGTAAAALPSRSGSGAAPHR